MPKPGFEDIAGPQCATDFMKKLEAAGIAPPNLRRVIIELTVEELPRVFYETYGCRQMFELDLVDLVDMVKSAEILNQPTPDTVTGPSPDAPEPPEAIVANSCPKCRQTDQVAEQGDWLRCARCQVTFKPGAADGGGG